MHFEGIIVANADQAAVWRFLLDVDAFAACVPGVGNVRKIDDQTFEGTIAASVGPISGEFAFTARIVESDPPNTMSAQVDGADSVTKSVVHADMRMNLSSPSAHRTELAYTADVDVKGRLALIGDMVLMATAKLMLQEFANRLRQQVEALRATG